MHSLTTQTKQLQAEVDLIREHISRNQDQILAL